MKLNKVVEEKDLYPDSYIYDWNPKPDYYDSFSITFSSDKKIDLERCFRVFYTSFPKWFSFLMSIRQRLASMLGLKTLDSSVSLEEELAKLEVKPGKGIGFFKIYSCSNREVFTGENDKHLDFRLSFFLDQPSKDVYKLTLTTSVKMNAMLGKLYFLPVKPIHRLIVPVCCKRMVDELIKG